MFKKKLDNLIFFLTLCLFQHACIGQEIRILVGSPIHQKPAILREFLKSLKCLYKKSLTVDYCFIDDNNNQESSKLLDKFSDELSEVNAKITIVKSNKYDHYECNDHTHQWNNNLIWKVASFKDQIISKAKQENYDYLFLIDSDLILHPYTLKELIKSNKNIISNIFWTQWTPESIEFPQVWLYDSYTQFEHSAEEHIDATEVLKRRKDFFAKLRQPGIYEVGGLGACTLISKDALLKGVSFEKIKNITLWGEDRHFCIRAVALGLSLYVNTQYPALHVYRESDLKKIEEFVDICNKDL